MAKLTEEQLEQMRGRQRETVLRRQAREAARDQALEAYGRLLAGDPPDRFSPEQVAVYRAELARLRYRVGAAAFGRFWQQSAADLARGRA